MGKLAAWESYERESYAGTEQTHRVRGQAATAAGDSTARAGVATRGGVGCADEGEEIGGVGVERVL